MANGFDFYEGTKSENTTPRITVRKGGQLVLTRGAVEMLGEGVSHVQLGYHPENKRQARLGAIWPCQRAN